MVGRRLDVGQYEAAKSKFEKADLIDAANRIGAVQWLELRQDGRPANQIERERR